MIRGEHGKLPSSKEYWESIAKEFAAVKRQDGQKYEQKVKFLQL
jgi:hypothetical protein